MHYVGSEKAALEVLETNRIVLKQGVIPAGTVVECYPGGIVKRMPRYHNQKPEGRSVTHYPTGELWEEQYFKEGKLEGPCAVYRKDGMLWRDSSYGIDAVAFRFLGG
jgi:antitoxin component YwqK of YwqJK toxin-antitoxin module